MSPPFAPPRQIWLLPRIALILFVAAVLGLLLYLRQTERQENRLVLINDVLWIEQNLRFQFDQTEERLAALLQAVADETLTEAAFRTRAQLIIETNHAVVGLTLRGANTHYSLGQTLNDPRIDEAISLTGGLNRPAYTDLLTANGELALVVNEHGHQLIALISLPRLLTQQVPWWFANKYRLSLLDGRGKEIASKSRIAANDDALSYQLPFDPPGRGMVLKVSAYPTPSGGVQRVLISGVVILAMMVLLSWWRLRRQVQGRLSAEAALREEHAFRTAMEDSLSVGMRARDLQGRIIYANPAFCRMVGYSSDELMGALPPYPYWNPDDLAGHHARNEEVLSGRAPQDGFEITLRHRDGHLVSARVYTAPLIDARGEQRGWMSSIVDITSQKQAEWREREHEEKLRQTGRLIAMGEMASTLAHELNQPLMALTSYASAAKQFAAQSEPALLDSTLDKIAEQAQRAAGVVRRIREFVRKHAPHREECNLNTVITDALDLIEPDAKARGIKLQRALVGNMPAIHADRVLLGQVVVNLLRNAMDACTDATTSPHDVAIQTEFDDNEIRMTIADSGTGIAPDVAARLYEAFFTTKPLGMGIGLNICRSIIEQHHGKLWHTPRQPHGTLFHLSLPRS